MKVAPWVKWYAGDFLHGVAEMGPNEGWVYTVVLNLIYDHGGPIRDDIGRLARRRNMRPTSVEKAVRYLVEAGKLTRADGVLANARADKELKSRQEVGEKSSQAISLRWQKVREKANKINGNEIPTNYERSTDGIPTRSQKPDSTYGASAPIAPAEPDPFEAFWSAYPKREGDNPKKPARSAYASAVKRGADPAHLLVAVQHLAGQHPRPTRFVPRTSTWLNEERYADIAAAVAPQPVDTGRWQKRLEHARQHRSWALREWGPMPGSVGCLVPADLIREGDGDGWVAQREAA